MKTADLKPGTLYALRYAKYGSPQPLLLLSTTLHTTFFRTSGLAIASSHQKAGRGYGYGSRDIGLPTVTRFSVDQVDTPEKLAAFYQSAQEHFALLLQEGAPSHAFQPAGFEDCDTPMLQSTIEVLIPQQFMGPWATIKAQYDADIASERANQKARQNADHAAQVDYDALTKEAQSLGITSLDRTYGSSSRTKVEIDRADLWKLLESYDPRPTA